MSNFNFLNKEWPSIYTEAKEAENLTYISPKACVIICRSALEKAVNWLYNNDLDLSIPYDTTLSSLIHEQCFKDILKPSMFREINLIRKFGNNAAHGNTVKNEEALIVLKNLFRFLSFIAKIYPENPPEINAFDETIIPAGLDRKIRDEELKIIEAQLDIKNKQEAEIRQKFEEQLNLNKSLQEKHLQLKEAVKLRKDKREKGIDIDKEIPILIPESLTRKLYIDQSLKEAGWSNLRDDYELEYEVKGMPLATNPSGIGYADYVLWGDDGKPIAVIEAKKTMVDASKGKHQSTLYADCLEQMHGQRPVIFYTNGFETYLWDDTFYPARQVHGFYTKEELQSSINRRSGRKDLRDFKVNENIAGRYYQKEAILRVAESFLHQDSNGQLKAGARKALLVMATGSGKTRTSIAIVDMLIKSGWAKRVLFLADRNALVKQAKNAFTENLPHLSSIDLTKEKEDPGTRLVFSTYPTIMNKIDSVRNKDDRFYGVGHFDLIIIDEAHRSVYQKYGAIFEYFDSLLVGLTATPKKTIDRNTYSLFEIEDDNPTYAYELDQAVRDGFLVPPKAMSVPVKFLREGIKYDELSDREKEEYEEKFGDPTQGEAPDEISSTALNTWLFNTDTVDKVLNHLMTKGIKVQGGDKLGKTIIFAKSHAHAVFIEERFNKNFPEYAGKFLRVIDNYEAKAQDLLEKFVDANKENDPQIAVSVDMMDTGVDAPRVVNLVFFKMVKAYSKFWQMIGRGTRLYPDLFGPGDDKKYFIIFDYCENFEFFKVNPDGIEGSTLKSLTQQTFELKLDVIFAIRDKQDPTDEEKYLEELYTSQLHTQIKGLDKNRFMVQMNHRYVTYFSAKESWQRLKHLDLIDLKSHVSKLILPEKEDHELARRFDIIMLSLNLAILLNKKCTNYITKVSKIARKLSSVNVPNVKANLELLKDLQDDKFWKMTNVKNLDNVREVVRELMKYLESNKVETVYTGMEDEIDMDSIVEEPLLGLIPKLQSYRDRVETYIRKNQNHFVIHKLRHNIPITESEIDSLEEMLFDGNERGTKEEFAKEYKNQPLGKFIRSIVGLDIKTANEAFSDFIQKMTLRADQIKFINTIITFLEKNGTIDKAMLFESPFTDINDQGIIGVFDDAETSKVINIIDVINRNAGVA
ncbi:MAG: DEAD/DEAH box helicase family protein [Bacteroidales bacterium]|nr:DEAD/DEAH box helicase family protein [Bacteroidales bacterium]